MGTFGALAAAGFLALTGEGFGFGAFTALVTAVVSLATVLATRLTFGGGGASSSDSDVFFALLLEAAGAALGTALDATLGAALDAAFGLAGSVADGTSLVGFATFCATAFFTGLWIGLAATLAFLGAAFGFAAVFAAGLATSTGLSSTSATFKRPHCRLHICMKKLTCQQITTAYILSINILKNVSY